MIESEVILVDENDNEIGTAGKLEAHQKGLCHRAFSVFIIRQTPRGVEVLLQQRHIDKYHSGGLWTNTCCSHPKPGEGIVAAGERRLFEEMGIDATLEQVGIFHYIAPFANGLTENEVDHVLLGTLEDEDFTINAVEVAAYQWVLLEKLPALIAASPETYTPWLLPASNIVIKAIKKRISRA
jgi:isopentenyl-diphosphate delta-isomerase type 1